MPSIPDAPGPYRFFFYSFDCAERIHVHVQRDHPVCKFWLEPLVLDSSGFAANELNRIRRVIFQRQQRIREAWDEHCGKIT
jgi:hypothetical protein